MKCLSCHSGHLNPDIPSGYVVERDAEWCALCVLRVRRFLQDESFQLVRHHQAGTRLEHVPA